MENIEEKAAKTITEKKAQGKSYEEMASASGFRKEKLFQWERLQRVPTAKVARKLLRSL